MLNTHYGNIDIKEEIFEDLKKELVMVIDINGVEIKQGQIVLIHHEDVIRKAVVVEVFPDNPTVKEKGFWVDVSTHEGIEGMMSYILEVVYVRGCIRRYFDIVL